ncbi:MAG: polyprenyl synthetase family protein, partial [Legionellales bacterium]|nr:polyprenyl synthetase family protein [Legionellales bacterium]
MLTATTPKADYITTIKATISTELAAVEKELNTIQSDIPILNEVASQLLRSGGKRLRPIMAIASALSCGYEGNTHIELAAVIELIHAATLLHDDVIDNSIKRRCQDTANKVWGNKHSILAGDYIYSIAFQKMVAIRDPKVLKILSEATSYIVEGEIIQL